MPFGGPEGNHTFLRGGAPKKSLTIQGVGTLSASKGTVIASVMAVNGEHKEHHNAIRL